MLNGGFQTFEHKRFYSIVDRDDGQSIPNYFATNIENYIIRNKAELVMRDGLTARGTNPNKDILGATVLYRSSGTKKFLRVISGAANASKFQHSDDGTTWTDVTSGGSKNTSAIWSFVQANDFIYGVNGNDTPIKYDGSTVSTVVAIPQGTAIEWWKNFLWVFGNPTYKDRLYFSGASTPETFGGSDYININLGDASNGIGIKGVAGSSGRLYIGKQRSVWYITGYDADSFALAPLTYEHGVASHESMIQVGNSVWCIDLEGNIRDLYRTLYDTPFSGLASKDIQYTVSSLNKGQLSKTTAVFYDNYAMFFIPYGINSYNSIVLVWDTLANEGKGGWCKFTGWNICRAVVFNVGSVPTLFLFDSRTNNGQTYQWTGTSDNGIHIIAKYETKIYDFGFPAQEKKFKFTYQFAEAQGDFTSRFYASVDRYYYNLLASPSLLGTGNKKLGQTWTLGVDKLGSGGFVKVKIPFSNAGGQSKGSSVQIKLECESNSVKLKLRQFTIHYLVKGLR